MIRKCKRDILHSHLRDLALLDPGFNVNLMDLVGNYDDPESAGRAPKEINGYDRVPPPREQVLNHSCQMSVL